MKLELGDYVTVKGEQRTIYRVSRVDDRGQVHMYGGDPDPKGRRGWRVVRPACLKPALKKHLPKERSATR